MGKTGCQEVKLVEGVRQKVLGRRFDKQRRLVIYLRWLHEASTGCGIKGADGLNTGYHFDIVYNKSGTNPQGKANIMIESNYKKDGTLDDHLHTYLIQTNAIASLNVTTLQNSQDATGTFSAKANLIEQMPDLSTRLIREVRFM